MIQDEDKKANDITSFVRVLEMYEHLFIGDATYEQNKKREEKLRRPQEQPLQEDIQAVRSHTLNRMAKLEDEVLSSHTYIELRDLVVSRLVQTEDGEIEDGPQRHTANALANQLKVMGKGVGHREEGCHGRTRQRICCVLGAHERIPARAIRAHPTDNHYIHGRSIHKLRI